MFRIRTLVLALSAAAPGLSLAAPPDLYGINFGFAPTQLYKIDRATGAVTGQGDIGIFGDGLTFDSKRHVFYASDPAADKLFSIPLGSVAATSKLSGLHLNSLAYSPDNDRIYAIGLSVGTPTLYEINPVSFAVKSLGNPGVGAMVSLAYHEGQHKLFSYVHGGSNGSKLVRLNDLNNFADVTTIRNYGQGDLELVTALAYDGSTGQLFGSASNNPFRSLVTIDPLNGQWTTVGSFGLGNDSINGLAVAVPEPGTYALMAAGLAGLAFGARRRKA